MARDEERRHDSLPLRSAYARRREWVERLAAAQGVGNEELAQQAARYVAEWEELIAELEKKAHRTKD
jgi:hypothetical protein